MPPKPRPFFPEKTIIPSTEDITEMNPTPETTMSPEQEYIDAQIRTQVQAQIQTYIQAQLLSQTQANIQSQAQSLENPTSHNHFQHAGPSLTNRIRLPDSVKFDGKVSEYTFFISRMEISFWGAQKRTASTWFRSLISANSPCLENFELFMQEFKNNFSDPSHTIKAREQIRNCKQGSRSASAYAAEFRALARESGFNNVALVDQFLRGLSSKIMQYLIVIDLPDNLEENIILAVRIDNCLCTMNVISDSKNYTPNLNPFRSANTVGTPPVINSTPPHQEPIVYIEIEPITSRPRGQLSEKEKARRYELCQCLYCGGSGHIDLNCTKRKWTGKSRIQHFNRRFIFKLKLFSKTTKFFVQTNCLVDSGVTDNFIDKYFAEEYLKVPSKVKDLIHNETIDGISLTNTPIDTIYEDVKIIFDNVFNDNINLYPINSPKTPMILGLPWLKKNNSRIDWVSREFNFNREPE
ncbi:Retrotransposon-derived protein PEG10 [Smittium culicis]|uniref:Retrotransposon-derived protein PEG10 n=1 Tax=Smittium culicis TaxID=133412 RepID=A0A1R1XV53_9FUNG|nr:Retrotransposon-derived protein PEG10 [Smittium culicis]